MQTYLSMTPPESPLLPRLGASESSSSKKITHGEALRALLNTADKDRNNIVNSEMLMASVKKLNPANRILLLTVIIIIHSTSIV